MRSGVRRDGIRGKRGFDPEYEGKYIIVVWIQGMGTKVSILQGCVKGVSTDGNKGVSKMCQGCVKGWV